jgi:hypothetical protein
MATDNALTLFGNALRQLDEAAKTLKSIEAASGSLSPGGNAIGGGMAPPAVLAKAAETAAKATDLARDALQLYARLGGAQQPRTRRWWWRTRHN